MHFENIHTKMCYAFRFVNQAFDFFGARGVKVVNMDFI
jgi:hypothetical protein